MEMVEAPTTETKLKKKCKKKKSKSKNNHCDEKCTENGVVADTNNEENLSEKIKGLHIDNNKEQSGTKVVNGIDHTTENANKTEDKLNEVGSNGNAGNENSNNNKKGGSTNKKKKNKSQQQKEPNSTITTTTSTTTTTEPVEPVLDKPKITYKEYESELQMPDIMQLIQKDLSEPYSIYTYRYFIHNWPKLCFLAMHEEKCVGAIVCKLDMHKMVRRGYIAMLAVDKDYRKLKIGTTLVQKAIEAILRDNADEVVLETEITNRPALKLYENLGFVRDKRLFHYYLNGVDALRLKLWFR